MIYEVKVTSTPPIMTIEQVMHRLGCTYDRVYSMANWGTLDICYPFPTLLSQYHHTPIIFIVHNEKLQWQFDQIELKKKFLECVEATNKMMQEEEEE